MTPLGPRMAAGYTSPRIERHEVYDSDFKCPNTEVGPSGFGSFPLSTMSRFIEFAQMALTDSWSQRTPASQLQAFSRLGMIET